MSKTHFNHFFSLFWVFVLSVWACLANADGYEDPTFEQDALRVPRIFKPQNFRDNDRALIAVGLAFEAGLGVKKDEDFAIKWYVRAGSLEPSQAAWELILLATQNGNRAAIFNQAIYAKKYDKDYEANEPAIEMLVQSSDKGFLEAKLELGFSYYEGDIVKRDYAKAIAYLRAATIQGTVLPDVNPAFRHTLDTNAPEDVIVGLRHLGMIYNDKKSGFYNPEQAYYFMVLEYLVLDNKISKTWGDDYPAVSRGRRLLIQKEARKWRVGKPFWEVPSK